MLPILPFQCLAFVLPSKLQEMHHF